MAQIPTAPTARDDVEVNEVEDGLVIYDTARDRVHYLNHTAALVFALCTGTNTVDVIAAQVGQAFDLDGGAAAEVDECLDRLAREGLLA